MTCLEKMKQEHPELVGETFHGGAQGCPHYYGYIKPIEPNCYKVSCKDCWNREIPGTPKSLAEGRKDLERAIELLEDLKKKLASDDGLHPKLRSVINDIEHLQDAKDYRYIILGKGGPTGKTTLCNILKKKGYDAIDISELVNGWIECPSVTNFHVRSEHKKIMCIFLNEHVK